MAIVDSHSMKKLPIGISTLEKMLRDNYVYVDKTRQILSLAEAGDYYFLSRPRRFGKSLLIDTLRELFAGNEALFKGLYIHPHWDWSIKHPIIHISFGSGVLKNRVELDQRIHNLLQLNQQRLGIDCDWDSIPGRFGELIRKAQEKFQQGVVILIDEYDKPMLDNITDPATAAEMRDGLKNLYSVIKDHDAYVRFAFLTGVSKFSKVSVFSGLNNLKDITLDERYGAICGYTQTELEHNFAEHLQDIDLEEVRNWYNGYRWLGDSVYNPFDILLFLDTGKSFRPYWFETGTPGFLIDMLKTRYYHLPDLEELEVSSNQLGDFDIDHIRLETLLFQTGYLTISRTETLFNEPVFLLSYPNREVRSSFNQMVLERYLTGEPPERLPVLHAFLKNDFETLKQRFVALFENIAHDNYRNNPIAQYEGYYASVMYAYLCSLGLETLAEDTSNRGRIDLTLRFKLPDGQKQVYIFEFKVIDGEQADGSALQQIKQKNYAAKYDDGEQRIFLIGMEFSKVTRNIVGFVWEVFCSGLSG
jgi:hypothetical protein